MATKTRRPLPALAFLVGLTILTTLVWWRVIHRNEPSADASPTCTPTAAVVTVVPPGSAIRVHVRNATNPARSGLAAQVRDGLAKAGFVVPDIGNADKPVAGVAEIRHSRTGKAAAQHLAYYLPGAKLIEADRSGNDLELAVGNGFKAVAPTAQAQQAMRAAKVQVGNGAAPATAASC